MLGLTLSVTYSRGGGASSVWGRHTHTHTRFILTVKENKDLTRQGTGSQVVGAPEEAVSGRTPGSEPVCVGIPGSLSGRVMTCPY